MDRLCVKGLHFLPWNPHHERPMLERNTRPFIPHPFDPQTLSIRPLLLALAALAMGDAFGQCQLITTAPQTTITCGQCVTLSAFGNGTGNVAFTEDFNTGAPVGWQFTQSAQFNNPCGPGNGTPYLWMGPGSINPRTMVTLPLDLSLGGNICFDMRFAVQGQASPCEGPDEPQEGVFLDYSINGGANWVTINYFNPNGGNDPQLTNWNTWCFAIPLAAQTPNTLIRWHQNDVSDDVYDHWGIDNIVITLNDPNFGIVWQHDGFAYGLGNGGGANPTPVCPLETTTYTAIITDGTTTCTDEITITVVDPVIIFDMGDAPDLCNGDCVTLDVNAYHQVSPASTPTFSNSQLAPVLSGSASMNINVQGLNNTSLSDGSITQVCISNFTFSGTSICLNFGGCPCNGGTVGFGQQCDLNPGSFTLTLNAPGGCGSIVLAPAGAASGTYNNTCFVPVGGSPIAPPFPSGGTWAPQEPFSTLNGCDPNGVWSVTFNAPGLGLGIGLLTGWNISFDDPEITGPVIFSWDPTTAMTDPDTFTPTVCPTETTTYTLSATNQAGCAVFSAPITVNVDNCCQLSISAVEVVPASCAGNDGAITIAGLNDLTGTPTYALDGGPPQASATFSGLAPGSYVVTVNDDLNCPVNITLVVGQSDGPVITDLLATDTTCGLDNGTLTVSATGDAPLSYSIDLGATTQPDGAWTGLPGDDYTVTVTDGNGCATSAVVSIGLSAAPSIDGITTSDPACGVADGAITVVATGNALQYSIDGGATWQAGNVFQGLAQGAYTVVVVDAAGCTAQSTVDLNAIDGPAIDQVSTTAATCGLADGSITVLATGTAILFSLDGGTTTQPGGVFSVAGGTYTVTVVDAIGCTSTATVTVDELPGPTITGVQVNDPLCGQPTGSIVVTASQAGTQFSVDGGATFQPGGGFDDLTAGTYTVVVDLNGCTDQTTVQLTTQPAPDITLVVPSPPLCNGQGNGALTITATGTAPLLYSITGGQSTQAGNAFGGLLAGTYTVVVVDPAGCADTLDVVLPEPAVFTASASFTDPGCNGQCSGTATISTAGGTAGAFTYTWPGGVAPANSATASGLCAGAFTVQVADANGCPASTTFTLTDPPPFVVQAVTITGETCPEACDGIAVVEAPGAVVYSINNGFPQAGAVFGNLCPGTYTLQAATVDGCVAEAGATIAPGEAVTAFFTSDPVVATTLDPRFSLINGSTNAVGYLWQVGPVGTSTQEHITVTLPNDPQELTVCLTATNAAGCADTYCSVLVVLLDFAVHVPNAFTPDGDGINDEFRVVGDPLLNGNFKLEIFDRWGELIFVSTDIRQGWDGSYGGDRCAQGVYVWQVAVQDPYGAEIRSFRGHVTLLR